VTETLASEAPLFLDLAAFHAADISLSNKETIVEDVFGSFCRVKPDTKRRKLPQSFIFPLKPCQLFDLEALFG
jgi:hypothetical protein